MNLKKAKEARRVISTLWPDKKETLYRVLRANTLYSRQFVLDDCQRYYYQRLKKEMKLRKSNG